MKGQGLDVDSDWAKNQGKIKSEVNEMGYKIRGRNRRIMQSKIPILGNILLKELPEAVWAQTLPAGSGLSY